MDNRQGSVPVGPHLCPPPDGELPCARNGSQRNTSQAERTGRGKICPGLEHFGGASVPCCAVERPFTIRCEPSAVDAAPPERQAREGEGLRRAIRQRRRDEEAYGNERGGESDAQDHCRWTPLACVGTV